MGYQSCLRIGTGLQKRGFYSNGVRGRRGLREASECLRASLGARLGTAHILRVPCEGCFVGGHTQPLTRTRHTLSPRPRPAAGVAEAVRAFSKNF